MQDKTIKQEDIKLETEVKNDNKCSFIKKAGKVLLYMGLGACAFAGGKLLYDKIMEDNIELE